MQAPMPLYQFKSLRRDGGMGQPCACFQVEDTTGQTHEELLNFTTIEARLRLWDDEASRRPDLMMRNPRGFANYRQFVRALVEGLRAHLV